MASVQTGMGIRADVIQARSAAPRVNVPAAPGLSTSAFLGSLGQFVGAFGALQQARFNRDFANRNARQIELSGEVEVARLRQDRRKRLAATRVAAAASGGAFTGSILDILAAEAAEAEQAALLAEFGVRVAAQQTRIQGQIARAAGTAALVSGIAGGISTIASDQFQQRRRGQIA